MYIIYKECYIIFFSKQVRKSENINKLLAIIETYCQKDVPPQADIVHAIIDMGFDEDDVREALKVTRNNKAAAVCVLL